MANLHWVENPEEEGARRQQEQEALLKAKQEIEEKEATLHRSKIKTPLLIAAILGWVWVLIALLIILITDYTDVGSIVFDTLTTAFAIIASIISLISRKKDSLALVITAIVLYCLSMFGIISAILCIVAAVRMKKLGKKTTA